MLVNTSVDVRKLVSVSVLSTLLVSALPASVVVALDVVPSVVVDTLLLLYDVGLVTLSVVLYGVAVAVGIVETVVPVMQMPCLASMSMPLSESAALPDW